MVRILGLRLPAGYAAERHLDHIKVSLRGRQIGCLVPDIVHWNLDRLSKRHASSFPFVDGAKKSMP